MKTLKERITDITDDYGSMHEYDCDLNREDGSDDGCECLVKSMVDEVVESVIEFLSHDMEFNDEEQRKVAVKMYIDELKK